MWVYIWDICNKIHSQFYIVGLEISSCNERRSEKQGFGEFFSLLWSGSPWHFWKSQNCSCMVAWKESLYLWCSWHSCEYLLLLFIFLLMNYWVWQDTIIWTSGSLLYCSNKKHHPATMVWLQKSWWNKVLWRLQRHSKSTNSTSSSCCKFFFFVLINNIYNTLLDWTWSPWIQIRSEREKNIFWRNLQAFASHQI